MKKIFAFFMMSLIVVTTGCAASQKENPPTERAELVASEKTLPRAFERIASVEEPDGFAAVHISNQNEYEQMWQQFQLEGDSPDIDLAAYDLLFVGMFESSSCPYEIEMMTVEQEAKELSITFSPLDDVCTADLSPRNFVIAIPKKDSTEVDTVNLIYQHGQTRVPIQAEMDGNS